MSNLKQLQLGFKMAIDDDGGHFGPGLGVVSRLQQSAQSQRWESNWGIPGKGSICPSAPDRTTRRSLGITLFQTPDTVNSAWVDQSPALFTFEGSGNLIERIQFGLGAGPRVGSYGHNGWISGTLPAGIFSASGTISAPEQFGLEEAVQHPAETPVFGDGVRSDGTGLGFYGPRATDPPASNLVTGDGLDSSAAGMFTLGSPGMPAFTIPRHGSRPSTIPTRHPSSQRLPGAINLSFYDGHVEQVKLDRLWQLYWHKGYVPPAKRPGL